MPFSRVNSCFLGGARSKPNSSPPLPVKRTAGAANVYVTNVRRIAQEVGWALTDLDELGLLYVQAMAERVDGRELTRTDALFRMRLMEKMILDEYSTRGSRDPMDFWLTWQQVLDAQRMRETVTCFASGAISRC